MNPVTVVLFAWHQHQVEMEKNKLSSFFNSLEIFEKVFLFVFKIIWAKSVYISLLNI